LRDYFALDLPEPVVLFSAFGIGAVACGVLELGWQVSVRVGRGRVSGGWVSRTARSPGDQ
jgi:hypothetical protein